MTAWKKDRRKQGCLDCIYWDDGEAACTIETCILAEPDQKTDSTGKYLWYKPKDCRYCFWYGKSGCVREGGEKNCAYLVKQPERKKQASPCDGCPYGIVTPCIGICWRKLLKEWRCSHGV